MESATHILSVDMDASELFSAPNEKGTPERNLLMAILERAILDYVGNDEKEVQAVEDWIFTDNAQELESERSEATGEFSFPWICEQLDLNPPQVAELIKNMPKRGSRRVAPWYFKEEELKQAG